jgi:hypothetical protein
MKDSPAANDIKNQVLFNKKALFSFRLWTVIIGKKEFIAGELLVKGWISLQALEKVYDGGHGI